MTSIQKEGGDLEEYDGGKQDLPWKPVGYQNGQILGGMMTVGVFLFIYIEAYFLFPANKNHAISTYNVKSLTLDNEETVVHKPLSLNKMKDSFDFIFGFNSFNETKYGSVLDNDYWKIEAFLMINDKMDTSKPIDLKKC